MKYEDEGLYNIAGYVDEYYNSKEGRTVEETMGLIKTEVLKCFNQHKESLTHEHPLADKIIERNNKPYSEILKELTEPLDLIQRHKAICEHLNKVYADKNHDYGNSFGDTFEKYGDISALVRISDKMNRIDQLVQTGKQKVKDEALKDSILDMANYLIMWAMELEEEE